MSALSRLFPYKRDMNELFGKFSSKAIWISGFTLVEKKKSVKKLSGCLKVSQFKPEAVGGKETTYD